MNHTPTARSIEVAVRVRPIRGDSYESKIAWRVGATSLEEITQPDNVFTFDDVYDAAATTAEVYRRNVQRSIVERVAQGYNGTVFAYGQTGSGKSYTMFGGTAGRSPGLVRLAIHDLFKALAAEQRQRPYMRAEVFVSVLEIYNEQLRDLLRGGDTGGGAIDSVSSGPPARGSISASFLSATSLPAASPPPLLSIRESAHGVYVHNALRTQVTSEEECLSLIYTHAASRMSAATAMNEHSSRSHCVIRISVERSHYIEDALPESNERADDEEQDIYGQEGDDEEDGGASSTHAGQSDSGSSGGTAATRAQTRNMRRTVKHKKKVISTLNMVDLAGSERVAKTGATGVRMIEGGHINKSLATLTTVINRLASGANPPHTGSASSFIPYRDSRLTHLLKTAIGGNSFTVVLCCITPAIESVNESRSTLHFASRAKHIKNRVRINEVVNTQTQVRELQAVLRHTKRLLIAQTLYLWSKEVQLHKCKEQLLPSAQGNVSSRELTSSASGSARLMDQEQQQSMIVAQLTARNDALEEEVRTLRGRAMRTHGGADGGGDDEGSDSVGSAPVTQTTALLQSLNSTQLLLKERETALRATKTSLGELEGLCQELEAENKSQAEQIRMLTVRNSKADARMAALEEEHRTLRQNAALLQSQLQQDQPQLLEKHRGDDHLAEPTRSLVDLQKLQYSYSQLKAKADSDKTELMNRLSHLTERCHTLEDDLDDAKDNGQLLNSYLWRLMSAVTQTTQGAPREITESTATVCEAQVAEAIRSLTNFSGTAGTNQDYSVSAGESVSQLERRIRLLEEQLIARDAQRDVIIDTKLKRIQGLVLRLHTHNRALEEEMRGYSHDNERLFEIAMQTSKTRRKVEEAGLTVRSLGAALDRARLAQPPHKPLHHN